MTRFSTSLACDTPLTTCIVFAVLSVDCFIIQLVVTWGTVLINDAVALHDQCLAGQLGLQRFLPIRLELVFLARLHTLSNSAFLVQLLRALISELC